MFEIDIIATDVKIPWNYKRSGGGARRTTKETVKKEK
jgi:hypothetical protein